MSNQQQLIGLIKSISGQANILTIPRVFISLVNDDLEAALLLSQIVYWSDKSSRSDGWFWKKYDEWESEIGLSQFRVKRAASKLEKAGLIETKVKRANNAPTMHYRLIVEQLSFSIIEFLDNRETSLSESKETRFSENEVSQQSLTETTTETTTEIKDNAGAKPAPAKPPVPVVEMCDSGRYLLGCFGGKRLNPKQRETIAKYEETYGLEEVKNLIDWAANKNMKMGDAIISIGSSLAKKKSNGNGKARKVDWNA